MKSYKTPPRPGKSYRAPETLKQPYKVTDEDVRVAATLDFSAAPIHRDIAEISAAKAVIKGLSGRKRRAFYKFVCGVLSRLEKPAKRKRRS